MLRQSRQMMVLWSFMSILSALATPFARAEAGANTPSELSEESDPDSKSPFVPVIEQSYFEAKSPEVGRSDQVNAILVHPLSSPALTKGDRTASSSHPLNSALQLMELCRDRFAAVFDYEARIVRQERIGKTLMPIQDLDAKFRCHPHSVYLKWNSPEIGREAIYVEGRDEGKMLVHDAGIKKTLLGVQRIDPESPQAKRESRYTVREVGIGHVIDKVVTRWNYERRFDETDVSITNVKINTRPCILISAVHPRPDDGKFMFHTVRVYIDKEHMLPIRTEAYGYPNKAGREPGDLLESYTYLELRLNPGLTETDFSVANPAYEFSRF